MQKDQLCHFLPFLSLLSLLISAEEAVRKVSQHRHVLTLLSGCGRPPEEHKHVLVPCPPVLVSSLAASALSTEALLLCVTARTYLGSAPSCSGLLELLTESTKGTE